MSAADGSDAGATVRQARRVGALILALISLGLLALIVAGAFAIRTLAQSEAGYALVQHTLEVEVAITTLGNQVERSEAARRGYLLSNLPTGRETMRQSMEASASNLTGLERLTADNPEQAQRLRRLRGRIEELQKFQRGTLALIDAGRAEEARRTAFGADPTAFPMRDLRSIAGEMTAAEESLLAERDQSREDAISEFYIILAICAALVLAIIAASILVIRRYTTALALSQRELKELNANLEDAVDERTNELQRANEEIQRFAYIVSHDLRSPLVNVMGFTSELESARKPILKLIEAAEGSDPPLETREARVAVDEDLPEAVRFIRTSTEKMDRLINAILRLSREGRRTLAPERLAMTDLVGKAADGLQHRTQAIGAEIEVEQLPDLNSDRVAIEQIVSNLLENAVKYLKPDRPGRIRVSGKRGPGERVVFEFADNGRGIDPRDHQRIFDLFRRSGQQDQPGEGIGLAHVCSLVWRLGGTIEVQSELDGGATFRLSLPATMNAEDAG